MFEDQVDGAGAAEAGHAVDPMSAESVAEADQAGVGDPFDLDDDPAVWAALAARWRDHEDPSEPVDVGDPPGWALPVDPWLDGWLTDPPGDLASLDPDWYPPALSDLASGVPGRELPPDVWPDGWPTDPPDGYAPDPAEVLGVGGPPGWTLPADPWPDGWPTNPPDWDAPDPADPLDAGGGPAGWARPADPWPDGWLSDLPGAAAVLDPDRDPVVVAASYRPCDVPPESAPLTWANWQPSGWLALDLDASTAHPASVSDALLIDALVGWERLIGWATARQTRVLAEFGRRRPDDPQAVMTSRVCVGSDRAPDEVALALHLSRGTARNHLGRAAGFTETLTDTLGLLEQGRLDRGKAHTICDTLAFHTPETARAVEARVLPKAPEQTVAQLRAALWRALIAVDPRGASERHRAARAQRRVTLSAKDDGMASLWALLAAPDAVASYEWLTRLARSLGKDDPRPMDARRADLLVDLLTGRLELHDPDDPDDPEDTDTEDIDLEDTEPDDTEPDDTEPDDTEPDDTEPDDTEPRTPTPR